MIAVATMRMIASTDMRAILSARSLRGDKARVVPRQSGPATAAAARNDDGPPREERPV